MTDNMTNNESFYEAVLKQAVIQDYKRELAAIPPEHELAKTLSYSPRHIARMKKLFAAEARRELSREVFSIAKKTVAVAAIALAVLFGLLMLNREVRAVVEYTIIEWFEKFTQFESQYSESTSFDHTLRPTYVPEGFIEADVFEDTDTKMVTIIYLRGSERIGLTFATTDSSFGVNNEEVDYVKNTLNGVIYHIFQARGGDEDNSMVWEIKGIRFYLISTISIDELMLMAQSFPLS